MGRRDIVRQKIAGGLGEVVVGEIVEQAGAGAIDPHFELRQIDPLPAPRSPSCLQRSENCDSAVKPRQMVVVGKPDTDVLAPRNAGQIGQAG